MPTIIKWAYYDCAAMCHCRDAALNLSQVLLELGVDVALNQEPYAAPNPLTGVIEFMFVPPDYTTVPNFESHHAYSSAIILKSSIQISFLSIAPSNNFWALFPNLTENHILFLSIYCCPSTPGIKDSFESILLAIPSYFLWSVLTSSAQIQCEIAAALITLERVSKPSFPFLASILPTFNFLYLNMF